jgi:O-antigen ligase
LITLDDARPFAAAPAFAVSPPRLGTMFLEAVLYICILSSFLTIVQPAPYEFLALVLGLGCLIARVPIDRKVVPMVVLLFLLELGGLMSLIPVMDYQDGVKFMFISIYLAISGVIFAFVFSGDCVRRLRILRAAYIPSAVIAALLGIAGYFKLFPGAEQMFLMNSRAVSTFKDPNIFGPFLILPLLMIAERFLAGEFKLRYIVSGFIILFGLLLAFSRAAWGHFAISALTMFVLMIMTRPDARSRRRIVLMGVVAFGAVAALVVVLVSIEDVREMFLQRASLFQAYDTGTEGSRFNIQQRSIEEILVNPNGMGPWVFAVQYGLVSHNSYLGSFLNHGWLGGVSYIALVLSTLVVGYRATMVRTPWQDMMIPVYATLFGLSLESAIVDTDHWRHYYLLVGVIWGLYAATVNFTRRQARLQGRPATAFG